MTENHLSRSYNPEARRQAIELELVRRESATVDELARLLGASVATIRRDLTALEESNHMIRRTHGGAVARAPRGADQNFALREQVDAEAKAMIARAAVELIDPQSTLLLNDGSTVLALAREIVARQMEVMVVTTSVNVALFLSESPAVEVHLLGGRLRHRTLATAGDAALRMLQTINADCAFISAEAVCSERGVSLSYEADAAVVRAMRERSDKVIVGATARKVGQRDRFTALQIADVNMIVTDCDDEARLAPFRGTSAEIVTARHANAVVVMPKPA
jgi:DeoR/GlpR family transcriptional regulator of sugar metabolism